MDLNYFFDIEEKTFEVLEDNTTVCHLTIDCFLPFSLFNSDSTERSLENMLIRKNMDGTTFKVDGYARLKKDDVFDKTQGERLAYLKAKSLALKKIRKLYEWTKETYLPQYIDMIDTMLRKTGCLENHIEDYLKREKNFE